MFQTNRDSKIICKLQLKKRSSIVKMYFTVSNLMQSNHVKNTKKLILNNQSSFLLYAFILGRWWRNWFLLRGCTRFQRCFFAKVLVKREHYESLYWLKTIKTFYLKYFSRYINFKNPYIYQHFLEKNYFLKIFRNIVTSGKYLLAFMYNSSLIILFFTVHLL